MGFIYPQPGIDDANAENLNQILDAWTGVAGKGQPFNAVAVNDPINFAISARNLDPTNSRAAQFLKADGTVLFQCDASGVKVSPDGTVASVPITATATQTLTNKTFTSPHMTGPVVDSGGLTVVNGGFTVTAGTVQLVGPVQVGSAGWAAAGDVRFGNGGVLAWRNGAGTGDVSMGVTAGNAWSLSGFLTAAAATAGGIGVPATCSGFLVMVQGGVTYKIALYAN